MVAQAMANEGSLGTTTGPPPDEQDDDDDEATPPTAGGLEKRPLQQDQSILQPRYRVIRHGQKKASATLVEQEDEEGPLGNPEEGDIALEVKRLKQGLRGTSGYLSTSTALKPGCEDVLSCRFFTTCPLSWLTAFAYMCIPYVICVQRFGRKRRDKSRKLPKLFNSCLTMRQM